MAATGQVRKIKPRKLHQNTLIVESMQERLVKQILQLPDDLMESLLQTCRKRLVEEMVMEIGDAARFSSDPKTAYQVQQHLFHQFLKLT